MSADGVISLEIISDPICPWCYIGKVRLDRALTKRPDHPFRIIWRPFQLNPDMPKDGVDRQAYLEGKFGGPEGAAEVYGQIEQAAKADGLDVKFDQIMRTPNTIDAHRLIRWAATVDAQQQVSDALFLAYFHDGLDISDRDYLCEVAERIGLERKVVARMLEEDVDLEETRAEDAAARRAGVTGAPTFLINQQYVLPGAQPTETWLRVIDELQGALAAQASFDGNDPAACAP